MTRSPKTLRTCPKGHQYSKSGTCTTCPECEKEQVLSTDFLKRLSAPARRALEHQGINSLEALSAFSEKEILKWHGLGPASLPVLRAALEEAGWSFRKP
jgi:DNA-directed RNA polymerase alpha subunit